MTHRVNVPPGAADRPAFTRRGPGTTALVNVIERGARRLDRFQQRNRPLAFGFAVVKKYGDDDCGRLAGLIAYYGFFSLFPLLLVFVSVLGFALSGHPHLRDTIVRSAFGQFPVIGTSIRRSAGLHPLSGSAPAIVIGMLTALWAGLGVAQTAEVAMNTVWDVPRAHWPGFVPRVGRAFASIALFGTMTVLSTLATGYGSSGALPVELAAVVWVGALAINLLLFTWAFMLLTREDLGWRAVAPGASVSAAVWTVLQAFGGYYVTHQIRSASDVYGTFALVIALLVWIALGAQVALFGAEINVVRERRLWPRSLVQPPLNEGDRRAYTAIADRARMRPEQEVDVRFDDRNRVEAPPAPR